MTKDGCYALSSRRNSIANYKYNIFWNNLKMSKEGVNAGVVDLGEFDEGNCA